MDLNDLFITLVLVNCGWLLAMRPARLWLVKTLAILGLLGGTWLWKPELAGWIAIGPWALLIIIPMWLQHWSIHLMQQRQLGLARWTGALLAGLHPSASVGAMRRMIRVLNHLYRGEVSQGLQLAEQFRINDPGIRNLGMVIDFQMTGDWAEFEQRVQAMPFQGTTDPSLLSGLVQAAAERGAWDELIRLLQILGQSHFSAEPNAALSLRAFAILGDVATVQNLLLSSSHMLASETREFWIAVAEQVSGTDESARRRLLQLLPRASAALRPMVERRLATPTAGPIDRDIFDRGVQQLIGLRGVIEHNARYAILSGAGRGVAFGTYFLILAMIANYLREIPGGSEDTLNLERLGAMVVPMTGEPGEWTHVFTSGFLHIGPLHLAFNMLGLFVLGRWVERAWGPLRMLVLFMVCLVASAALLPWLTLMEPGDTAVIAGASGGIMGLMGGIFGHLLVGRSIRGTPLVRSQFKTVCAFIVLQSLCDLMTPQVSMACHLTGMFTGMIGGILVGLCGGRRVARRPV